MDSVNQWLTLLPSGGWQRLMCDALWQSTLIAGVGWLVSRFLVRQAAARSWMLLLTISACVAVPLLSAISRSAGWTALARVDRLAAADGAVQIEESNFSPEAFAMPAAETAFAESLSVSPKIELPPTLAANVTQPTKESVTQPAIPHRVPLTSSSGLDLTANQVLAATWLVASALLAVRLLLSTFAVRRILRRATPCFDDGLLAAAVEAAHRVGLEGDPTVLTSDEIDSPMVLAIGKPRLLVPLCSRFAPREDEAKQASQPQSVSPAEFDPNRTECSVLSAAEFTRDIKSTPGDINWVAAFTHELAHVARRDGWSRLWVELVAIALPLQPLLWLARLRYYSACEEACDDWSVATGSEPVDLAATLTAWLGRRASAPLTAIGMSSSKSRVLRLLSMRGKPSATVPRLWVWLSVPTTMLVVVGLAAAQLPSEDKKQPASSEPTAKAKANEEPVEREHVPVAPESTAELIKQKQEQLTELEKSLKALVKASDAPQYDGNIQRLREQAAALRKEIADRRNELAKQSRNNLPNQTGYQGPAIGAYMIEPPDVLKIDVVRAVPKKPSRIAPLDTVFIEIAGKVAKGGTGITTLNGGFAVDSSGDVVLGAAYGAVHVKGLTRSEAEAAVKEHLSKYLSDVQIALTIDESRLTKAIVGEHLVTPDGTVNLGHYGLIYVAGMTVRDATDAIAKQLAEHFDSPQISVDVFAYNSKTYYVIAQGADVNGGDTIQRFPITGNETVLDAISQVRGLNKIINKQIWIARSAPSGKDQVLPVRWDQIVTGGGINTNYQVLPGDRIFVSRLLGEVELQFRSGKIWADLLESDDENTWRWRLYLPKGNRYGWNVAYDDIPRYEPPAKHTSHIVSAYSNEPYDETNNVVLVVAKLRKQENGNWRLSVNSRIDSEDGEPRWQMSGTSIEIPADKLKWWESKASTDGTTLGDHGNVLVDAKDRIILLQRRPTQRHLDGNYGPADGPAPGFMIWMEKQDKAMEVEPPKTNTEPTTSSMPPKPAHNSKPIPPADQSGASQNRPEHYRRQSPPEKHFSIPKSLQNLQHPIPGSAVNTATTEKSSLMKTLRFPPEVDYQAPVQYFPSNESDYRRLNENEVTPDENRSRGE